MQSEQWQVSKTSSTVLAYSRMARAMGLDRMEISLPHGDNRQDATRKGRVIGGVTVSCDTGRVPVCRDYQVGEHLVFLSFY